MRRESSKFIPKYLVIRNGIFYYRKDIKQPDGKWKAFRKSLNTGNLSEALWKLEKIKMSESKYTAEELQNMPHKELEKLSQAKFFSNLEEMLRKNSIDYIMEIPQEVPQFTNHSGVKDYKISDLVEDMLFKSGNVEETQNYKRSAIKMMLGLVDLSMDSDYSTINSREIIDIIAKKISNRQNVKNDYKRKHIGILKELVTFANGLDSEHYKLDILGGLPKLKKTPKGERNPYMPFSEQQLSQIFNTSYDFFHSHPEEFIACLIGVFTGSRTNPAITLQYNDIVDGEIPYIHFTKNHPLKKFKTDATERKVPISKQLLDFGFVELIKQKQSETGAKGTDFIFKRTYKYKEPDKKFFFDFLRFLEKIGIKTKNGDRYSFHSFRDTISNKLKELGIETTRINAIGGWEGKGTMQTSYSKHELSILKKDTDKIHYNGLNLDYWKDIIHKAYLEL